MSIKLPTSMVFYAESANRPHYLLWWIPAEFYETLDLEPEALADLQANYPNGFEIEVQEDALEEFGISLSRWQVTPEELRAAFLQIHAAGNVPASGMIKAESLVQFAASSGPSGEKSILDILSTGSQSFSVPGSADASLAAEISIDESPEMTAGEDAEDFFKRLSGLP